MDVALGIIYTSSGIIPSDTITILNIDENISNEFLYRYLLKFLHKYLNFDQSNEVMAAFSDSKEVNPTKVVHGFRIHKTRYHDNFVIDVYKTNTSVGWVYNSEEEVKILTLAIKKYNKEVIPLDFVNNNVSIYHTNFLDELKSVIKPVL